MNSETDEVMNSLIGRTIVEWGGGDDALVHIVLDDGRVLVFMGLPKERSVH
jgi:hypothetical protein